MAIVLGRKPGGAGGGGGAPSGPAGGDLTGTYPNPSIANEAVTAAKMDSGAATAGQVPTADGAGAVTYQTPPGTQLAYEERTTSLTVTASTEAGANTIVTADAVSLDGSTPIRVEFFTPNVTLGSAGANLHIWLFDAVDGGAAASIGRLADVSDDAASNFALMLARLFTPAAGSHVFSARANSTLGTDPVFTPGAGGAGTTFPIYILVTAV